MQSFLLLPLLCNVENRVSNLGGGNFSIPNWSFLGGSSWDWVLYTILYVIVFIIVLCQRWCSVDDCLTSEWQIEYRKMIALTNCPPLLSLTCSWKQPMWNIVAMKKLWGLDPLGFGGVPTARRSINWVLNTPRYCGSWTQRPQPSAKYTGWDFAATLSLVRSVLFWWLNRIIAPIASVTLKSITFW